jgi:hypothetical protein
MLPEQRETLDEILVKIRAGRITRRTFLERAVALGLTSTVAVVRQPLFGRLKMITRAPIQQL